MLSQASAARAMVDGMRGLYLLLLWLCLVKGSTYYGQARAASRRRLSLYTGLYLSCYTYHAAGGGPLPLCAANPNPNPNQAEGPFPYALVARAEAQCYFELPDEVRAASKLVSQSSDLIRLVGDCRQLPPLG